MEKALAILEKYVQWIALGLGGLFLLGIVYNYVLQDPVTVKLGMSVSDGIGSSLRQPTVWPFVPAMMAAPSATQRSGRMSFGVLLNSSSKRRAMSGMREEPPTMMISSILSGVMGGCARSFMARRQTSMVYSI